MDYKTLIAYLIYWNSAQAETPVNSPELFGKDEKPDKLIIKNQIAYHFKKVVREVNQELFVSRRIDVSLLFAGIHVLKKTELEVRKLCKNLPSQAPMVAAAATSTIETRVVHVNQDGSPIRRDTFTLVNTPEYVSFKEAKARCMALGMQLPEIYTRTQLDKLTDFMSQNSIAQCFAGIEPDLSDAIPRHISTQYPIWKTGYESFVECISMKPADLGWSIDDGHAKFLYTSDRKLCVSRDIEGNPIHLDKYGSHRNREDHKVLSQIVTRIVCMPKWDGRTNIDPPVDRFNRGGMVVKTRFAREARLQKSLRNRRQAASSDMTNVQTLCFGVADQAKESFEDIQSKMTDLLALVDITVHTEVINEQRQKRVIPLFLAKFIFVTGVKLLWQLFGFVQKVKMNKRLKNIESMLKVVDNRSLQNSDAITNMTRLISTNSFAINQLSIRVDGLEARLTMVETQIGVLQSGITSLSYKLETVTALTTIDNLIIRTRKSMDSGYDILKDIIHSTKLKQTSPLVLPLDQIELVQNEISKVSTAVLDPDFSKMQSIVVSDPNDPSMLLVVVNVAALGRRNLELVKMIPVPYFESEQAYEIMLDYHTIVLDQHAHTFSILTEQEEYDCLFNRCYVGSSEQTLFEKSCGIPQFYDRHKDGCVSESVLSTGVYLKPMLPDGVIFALQHEVQSQVFCKDKLIGNSRKLNGTGILQLPNGCVLSVIDTNGKVTRVKGQPQMTMINAGDLDLMPHSPLSAMHTNVDLNNTRKATSVNAFVEARVSSVIKQVEFVDDKMNKQHTHVWALTGAISLFVMLILLAIYLLYHYSTRARRKMRTMRDNFKELAKKVLEPENGNPGPILVEAEIGDPSAPPTQRKRDVWMKHLREGRHRDRLSRHHRSTEGEKQLGDKERTYMSMSELDEGEEARYISRPLSRPSLFRPLGELNNYPREYPRIPTPMIKEAQEYELERLKSETELTEQLSETLSPRTVRRNETVNL